MKFIASLTLALCLSGCAKSPPPRDPAQETCRTVAVALAELEANGKCGSLKWEACPHAEQIENDLMRNLEKCDE